MQVIDNIMMTLEQVAHVVPLEIFAVVGSFVEEVIAPIPSPLVMLLAGSLANAQGRPLIGIIQLAVMGAIGKTIGAWILYFVADKLEDVVIGKFGKFLGVTHKEIESIGKKLNGGWKDNVFLFVARALPVMPSAPISLACGIIKLNKKTYLSSTFLGTLLRDSMYLYLGYVGLGNYKQIAHGFEGIESVGQIVLFVTVLMVVGWAYLKRRKHKAE